MDTLKRTIVAAKNELSKLSVTSATKTAATANGRAGKFGPSAVVFHIARVGSSPTAKDYLNSLQRDRDLDGLVFCADESLDWALGQARDTGQLNCWVRLPVSSLSRAGTLADPV